METNTGKWLDKPANVEALTTIRDGSCSQTGAGTQPPGAEKADILIYRTIGGLEILEI